MVCAKTADSTHINMDCGSNHHAGNPELTPHGKFSGSERMLDGADRGFDGRSQILSLVQVFEIVSAPLGCPDLFGRESEQVARVSFLRLVAAMSIQVERTYRTDFRVKTSL